MPELPEVEVTRRGLSCAVGKTVTAAAVRIPRLRDPVPDFAGLLPGLRLASLERRAKYLIWRFEDQQGMPAGAIVSHLGMSGFWRVWPSPAPAPRKHDHVDLVFGDVTLRLNDVRRFGSMRWTTGDPYAEKPLCDLGPEPFSEALTPLGFWQALQKTRRSIKETLLAGSAVVGCGNIYCSESLFAAGILPTRSASSLTKKEAARLLTEIRRILAEAIASGGTTLRDFHGPDGSDGYFALDCQVYGREGEACPKCGRPIVRIVQNGRSSFCCPGCQK